MCLDGRELRVNPIRKVGFKAVLDHGRVRGGHQVEVQLLTGLHDRSTPERKEACHLRRIAERTPAAEPGGITFTVRYRLRLTTVLSTYAVPVIFSVVTPSG